MGKVLLIEDDSLISNIFSTYLQSEGNKVASVEDGTKALQVATEFKPDIILLDLMVPKLGGTKILEDLRAKAMFKQVPILVYTNLTSKGQAKEVLSKGATEFFSKADTNPKKLITIIKRYLGK